LSENCDAIAFENRFKRSTKMWRLAGFHPTAVIAKAVRDPETCLAASAAWQPEQEIPLPTL
jgi:hypothetical protein